MKKFLILILLLVPATGLAQEKTTHLHQAEAEQWITSIATDISKCSGTLEGLFKLLKWKPKDWGGTTAFPNLDPVLVQVRAHLRRMDTCQAAYIKAMAALAEEGKRPYDPGAQ